MRDNPRYSIIPAGAVTDPRLEGRDLQVLGLLGCHTDKLGWVEASSQAELAELINCSRQTFQRSIVRLVNAGWVQTKTASVSQNGRPYASYAYRVIMDKDDPSIPPPEQEVAAPMPHDGAHGWAPCPPSEGRGCPRIHGHQEAELVRDQEDSVVESARPREKLVSNEASKLADEIAGIAGQGDDPKSFDTGWHGSAMRVQSFLNEGYHPEHLLTGARAVMAGKPAAFRPWSIAYFAKAFARARGDAEAPVPTAEVSAMPSRDKQTPRPGSREDRQERTANARRRFREFAYGSDTDGQSGSSEAGGSLPRGLPVPKPAGR